MKLKDYIEQNGLKTPWFAKHMGVSYNTLYNWMTETHPQYAYMELIKKYTNGQVKEDDWEVKTRKNSKENKEINK